MHVCVADSFSVACMPGVHNEFLHSIQEETSIMRLSTTTTSTFIIVFLLLCFYTHTNIIMKFTFNFSNKFPRNQGSLTTTCSIIKMFILHGF